MAILVTMASNTVSNEYANSFNYRFVKLMQGTFHQVNPRFGETAGLQCVCNSLMSIVWSSIKHISYWRLQDLDNILINGDILDKSLNVFSYLCVTDLPSNVTLIDIKINIEMLYNGTGIISSLFLLKLQDVLPTEMGNSCLF